MAARVVDADVTAIVDSDTTIALAAFIATATALTDYVSSKDTGGTLGTAMLLEIERYLAAHFYSLRDQLYRSKKTGDASATFQGTDGMRLDATHYGQQAIALDVTGCLATLNSGSNAAEIVWLGTTRSARKTYDDRNGSGW